MFFRLPSVYKNIAFSCQKIAVVNYICRIDNKMDVSMTVNIRDGSEVTNYQVNSVPNSYAELGEAPHWCVANQSLYYVDLNSGKLLRYDYQQNKVFKCKIEGTESSTFVIPVNDDVRSAKVSDVPRKFIVGSKLHVELVNWDGITESCCIEKTLLKVQNDKKFNGNRFNDAKCDAVGRLYAGTMFAAGHEFAHRLGELFMFDGKNATSLLGDLGISNGLTWNEKLKKFYFIDMADHNVKEFDHNLETGKICNPKVIFNLKKTDMIQHLFIPDGMTIDSEGNIYVAVFNGGTVYKVNPSNGKILLEIKFPCKQITSCAFGGPSLDILYVTTSSKFDEPPPAGMLFQVTGLGVSGKPMNSFKPQE